MPYEEQTFHARHNSPGMQVMLNDQESTLRQERSSGNELLDHGFAEVPT